MSSEIIVAVIAFCGTLVGTFGGIVAAGKLTDFRLKQLEKKVERHNSLVERTYVLEEKMRVANHRIDDLEAFEKEVEDEIRHYVPV
ncbi:MAG: hypothetical protein IJB67_01715 [Firmicutes bacterium]|nr:hypothetical protein [Bacillota bacterium]